MDRAAPRRAGDGMPSRALISAHFEQPAEDAFVAAVQRATGGNPLLVVELAAALRAWEGVPANGGGRPRGVAGLGPREIVHRLLQHLAGLPPGARELARAVAVLGGRRARVRRNRFAGLDPGTASPSGAFA